ncbi:hypothetical protein NBRC116592_29890 [Colwellia sp. KU-HH00111]|uniref:cysteine-rich CWC family protein n=1 Tax=Colwellia sp. KU-HH00111 TaxID=3127652 RepID=UPI003107DF7D
MNNTDEMINASLCPICQQDNNCGETLACGTGACNTAAVCWCNSDEVQFSAQVLNKVPDNAKGKACICKRCVAAS